MFPSSTTSTHLLINTDTPQSIQLVQELWDGYSRIPGLLTSTPIDERYKSGFAYDPATRKYYSFPAGRVVSDKRLRNAVKRVSVEASKRAKKEIQQLIAGTIILAVWYSRMRDLLMALYKTVWLVSIGGFLFDDDTQRILFYALILLQFGYLDNFASQLATGEQAMNGRAVSRAGMYGMHGYSEWQNIRIRQAVEMGYTEARRILAPVEYERHCHDSADRPGCIEVAAKGWMPIEQMTPLGDCTCYSHCLCDLEFR